MKLLVVSAFLTFCHISTTQRSPTIIPIEGGVKGYGVTTRTWDCCAPSCAHYEFIHTKKGDPIQTCQKDGVTPSTIENNGNSGCVDGGTAYTCSNQAAYVVNSTLAFGFSSFNGGTARCCMCVLLSFREQLAGKQMLVQVTNTVFGLGQKIFDIAIPGSGVGTFTSGCSSQWGAPETGWGDRYSGVSTIEDCKQLPADLQDGCRFRFEFMEGVSYPEVSFYEVECPAELINISKCGDFN